MMANLVFLEPNKIDAIPFTTSDVIAEYAEVQHHTVTRLVQKHLGNSLEILHEKALTSPTTKS